MKKEIKKLKNYLGRVTRDIERTIQGSVELQETFSSRLGMAKRLLSQKKDSSDKLYSLHAPETYCIAKGKAHKGVWMQGFFGAHAQARPGLVFDGLGGACV